MEKTGRLPKAIIPVHLYGMPVRMDRVMEVANRYGIPVLEDSKNAPFYGNGTSERLFEIGLCLPSGPTLTDDDIERVARVILDL